VEITDLVGNTTKNTTENTTKNTTEISTELVDFLKNVERLTTREIADKLNVTVSSVRVFCSKNKIKCRNDHVEFIGKILKYDADTNCTTSLDKLAKQFKINRNTIAKIVPPRKKRGSALLKCSESFVYFAEHNTLTYIVKKYKVGQKTVVDFCKDNNIEINKINKSYKKELFENTVKYIKKGHTNKQIADTLGVKPAFVFQVRKSQNLPPVTEEAKIKYTNELLGVDFYSQTETMRNKSKKLRSNLDSSVIDLFNEGKSLKEISQIKKCSDITVARFLKRNNVQYTTKSERLEHIKQQSKADFIVKSSAKFGHLSYNLLNWTGMSKHITITCPKHGGFKQTPINHLKSKHGCPVCRKNYQNTHRQNWSWDFVDFYTKNKTLGQKVGLFYKLKFKHKSGFEFIKVGITSRSIQI